MNDKDTEEMIQEKGLTAPRLSPADIDAVIVDEHYYVSPNTPLEICKLDLKKAESKAWILEVYLLEEKLSK